MCIHGGVHTWGTPNWMVYNVLVAFLRFSCCAPNSATARCNSGCFFGVWDGNVGQRNPVPGLHTKGIPVLAENNDEGTREEQNTPAGPAARAQDPVAGEARPEPSLRFVCLAFYLRFLRALIPWFCIIFNAFIGRPLDAMQACANITVLSSSSSSSSSFSSCSSSSPLLADTCGAVARRTGTHSRTHAMFQRPCSEDMPESQTS